MFPLPKSDGRTTRALTVLNRLDEVGLRAHVGRCAGAIARATDERHVLNGLVRRPGPNWTTADFVAQHRLRRQLQREYYDDDQTAGVGFIDVKNFFGECAHETAERLLLGAGAPGGAVAVIVEALHKIFPSGRGLPIGFEGSGPIANLFLARLDEELAARGFRFLRWTDDVDVFLTSMAQWTSLYDLVGELLAEVGLEFNDEKTNAVEKGDAAEHRLLDPGRDSVFAADGTDNIEGRLQDELILQGLGFTEERPPAHIRSWLGALRSRRDPAALEYLHANPHWLDREPRSVGNYLSTLAADPTARKSLDLDWLMDRAVGRAPSKLTAAGQLHACRALTVFRVDKGRGSRLHDFAWARAASDNLTLGAWAVRAWAASGSWRPKAAVHLVHTLDHPDYRRAAIVGFASIPPVDAARHLEPIRRRHPETAPVVALVTS